MTAKPRANHYIHSKPIHLSVVATLILIAFHPPRVPAAEPEFQPRFEKLSNGLRICIVEEHSRPLVSVQLWFKCGSTNDPPTLPGLCQVALAALAQQANDRSSGPAPDRVATCATLTDASYFVRTAQSDELDSCLAQAAAFLQPLQVTPEQLIAAREMAAVEWGVQSNGREPQQRRLLLEAMFPNHPYRNPPRWIGERLETVKPELVQEFYSRWLSVSNATLFIMGDVESAIAIQKAREHFDSLRWSDVPSGGERPLPERENVVIRSHDDALAIAWLAPPAGRMDRIILLVGREVLRQRLTQSAKGSKRSFEASEILSARDASVITLVERDANPLTAGLVLTELNRLAEKGCTESELIRARNHVRRCECESGFGFENWSLRLATSEMVAGDILLADLAARQALRVSVADVQRAARALTQGLRRVTLTPAPSAEDKVLATPNLELPLRPASRPAHAPVPAASDPPVDASQSGRLENGLRWMVDNVPPCGFVRLELRIRGKSDQPPRIDPIRPSESTSPNDLSALLDYRGLQSTVRPVSDGWSISIDGPRDEIDAMVELLGNARRTADGNWADFERLELVLRGDFSKSDAEAVAEKLGN